MNTIVRKFASLGILFFLSCSHSLLLQAGTFALSTPDTRIIGENSSTKVREGDTLADIARRYNMGNGEMRLANPDVDPWLPDVGASVTVPSQYILPDGPREGVVLNLAEKRLYYFPPRENAYYVPEVITHPISIGRQNWKTPLGTTRVVHRLTQPAWYPPKSVRAEHAANGQPLPPMVPPGPDNPLGDYALILEASGYLIHGTNKPLSIGMRVSHGCIRLYPEDIASLFNRVGRGTPVRIIDQPYKAGVRHGQLFVEVHPPIDDEGEEEAANRDIEPLLEVVRKEVADRPEIALEEVDWERVRELFHRADGVAQPVTPSKDRRDPTELPQMVSGNRYR